MRNTLDVPDSTQPKGIVNQAEVVRISDYGFPVFHCVRPVTPEDVSALEDEE